LERVRKSNQRVIGHYLKSGKMRVRIGVVYLKRNNQDPPAEPYHFSGGKAGWNFDRVPDPVGSIIIWLQGSGSVNGWVPGSGSIIINCGS